MAELRSPLALAQREGARLVRDGERHTLNIRPRFTFTDTVAATAAWLGIGWGLGMRAFGLAPTNKMCLCAQSRTLGALSYTLHTSVRETS